MQDNKVSPEILSFYKSYLSAHPELVQRLESQKYVFYIYLILTLLVVAFFGAVVIRPTVLTIFNLRSEFSENAIVLEQLEGKLSAISSLKQQKVELSPQLNLLDQVIPTSADIPQLVRKVETLAERNGVVLSRIEIGNIEVFPNNRNDSPFFTFNFNMSVRGDTQNLDAFLLDLIRFDRLVSIDRVSGGSVTSASTEYVIVGRSYFYSPPSE